jgi:hypothetical protein
MPQTACKRRKRRESQSAEQPETAGRFWSSARKPVEEQGKFAPFYNTFGRWL